MKKNITLKILAILVIVTICLISFIGIFVKNKNERVNVVPDYKLSKDLKGSRTAKLVVDSKTEELIFDSEGNVTEDGLDEEGNLKEGYTKKDEPINSSDILTQENFILCKDIIEKRLSSFGVDDYSLRLNNENGEMYIEVYENQNTDTIIYNLEYLGEFTIKDSETKEVLIDNADIKSAKAVYGTSETGTNVYLKIDFNKDGKKKFEDITRKYIKSIDEEGNSTTKKITINLDSEQLIETYFEEVNPTGILQLSIGTASTDSNTIQNYLEQASRNGWINRLWENANKIYCFKQQ